MRCRWRKVLHMIPLIKGIVSQESWTLLYQSDFSLGNDGWAQSSANLTSNYDSGDAGYESCLRIVQPVIGFSAAFMTDGFILPGGLDTYYRITFEVKPMAGSDHEVRVNDGGLLFVKTPLGVWNIVTGSFSSDENFNVTVFANNGPGTGPGEEILIGSVKIERRL